MGFLKNIWNIFLKTTRKFFADGCPQMAAALSYYAVFAIPSVLVLLLVFLNNITTTVSSRYVIARQVAILVGEEYSDPTLRLLENIAIQSTDVVTAQLVGYIALFIAATGIFGHVRNSLNKIWDIKPQNPTILNILLQRFFGLIYIFIAGFFISVTILLETTLNFIYSKTLNYLHISGDILRFSSIFSFLISFIVVYTIFRFIPAKNRFSFKMLLYGSFITTILLMMGRSFIAIYLQNSSVLNAYSAAGFVIAILFWIYYSSMILFYGAVLIGVVAKKVYHKI